MAASSIQHRIQSICVDTCNKNGWVIPFTQITLHNSPHKLEASHHSASISVDAKGEIFVKFKDETEGGSSLASYFMRFSPDGTLVEQDVTAPEDQFSDNIHAQPGTDHLIFRGYGDGVVVNRRDPYGSRIATIDRRADGQWLEYIHDVACAPNGMIAILDSSKGNSFGGYNTPFPRLPSHLPEETINLYAANGDPIRTLNFTDYPGLSNIALDGERILATIPYDPPTPLVYVFDGEGVPIGAIRIAELADRDQVNLRAFIVAEGRQILAVDLSSGTVFLFAMP